MSPSLRVSLCLLAFSAAPFGCSQDSALGSKLDSDPDSGTATSQDNSNSAGNSPESDGTCEQLQFDATTSAPQVMIALDQSSSMEIEGRWGAAVQAVSSVVRSLENDVAFGLAAFGTNTFSCGSTRMVSAPRLGNAETIINYMSRESPRGGTPIAEILEQIATYKEDGQSLGGLPEGFGDNGEDRKTDDSSSSQGGTLQGVSTVILVTDGAPNCNHNLDAQSCVCTHPDAAECVKAREQNNSTLCLDDDEATAAVMALRKLGVETYVIGYSASEWADTLDRMARAGVEGTTEDGRSTAGESQQGAYIPVENALQLEQSLRGVATGLGTCSFALEEEPADVTHVRVVLNGNELAHTSQVDEGGWALSGKTINLLGADCESVRDNPGTTLDIVVECEQVFFLR